MAAGCAMNIQMANPRPNVNIDKSTKTLALVFGSQVGDTFKVDNARPIRPATVHDWHQTLKNGFTNAFGDSYKIVDGPADLVLTIKRAEPQLVLAAYTTNGYGSMVSAAITGHITYAADLSTRDGQVVARSAGTVRAKNTAMRASAGSQVLGDAVESMYETIAVDVFKTK